jgi:hypothetical protein
MVDQALDEATDTGAVSDERNHAYPMTPLWDGCEHDWKIDPDSQFHNDRSEAVTCRKCGCPGDRDIATGDTYWPAT